MKSVIDKFINMHDTEQTKIMERHLCKIHRNKKIWKILKSEGYIAQKNKELTWIELNTRKVKQRKNSIREISELIKKIPGSYRSGSCVNIKKDKFKKNYWEIIKTKKNQTNLKIYQTEGGKIFYLQRIYKMANRSKVVIETRIQCNIIFEVHKESK